MVKSPIVTHVRRRMFSGGEIYKLRLDSCESKDSTSTFNLLPACEDEVFEENQVLKKFFTQLSMTSQVHSVVILGELSVGKSALCRGFFHNGLLGHNECDCDEVESPNYFGTTSLNHNIYERPVVMNGEKCKLRILDVNTEKHLLESCTDEMSANLGVFVDGGQACIVAYAVTDRGTFTTATEILTRLFNDFGPRMRSKPVILVGNKCDLVRKRQVSTNEGVKLARKFDVKFIETSATLNQNVEELFQGIINQIHLRKSGGDVSVTSQEDEARDVTSPRGNRAPMVKRFSRSFLNPFMKSKKDTSAAKCDEDSGSVTSLNSGGKSKSLKLPKRSLRRFRRTKTTELRLTSPCQDLSVL